MGIGRVEAVVPREHGVVVHLVAGQVATGHHRRPRRRARRRVRPVVGQLDALGHEPLPPRQAHRRRAATSARAPGRRRRTGCWDDGRPSADSDTPSATGGRRRSELREHLDHPDRVRRRSLATPTPMWVNLGLSRLARWPADVTKHVVDRGAGRSRRGQADVLAEGLPAEAAEAGAQGRVLEGAWRPCAAPSPRPLRERVVLVERANP